MADFTGFYLDGIHSSTYGILRVSDGDRYTEGLIPEFEDFSIELTGGNGDLYGGRRFKPTKFTINIAFDHMTEKQFRGLRQWLGGEKLKEFRFDERPYKGYYVKVAERPELDYVCFLEDVDTNFIEKERIYKGEGEIEFIAYDPFGYCVDTSCEVSIKKWAPSGSTNKKNWQNLRTYIPFDIRDENMLEWATVSGLKSDLDQYNIFGDKGAKLYNPGDFETDFQLLIPHGTTTDAPGTEVTLTLIQEDNEIGFLRFKLPDDPNNPFNRKTDTLFLDTKNHILQWGEPTNEPELDKPIVEYKYLDNGISNRYDLIIGGQWFKIPTGVSTLKVQCGDPRDDDSILQGLGIKYNYKYY
jgi:phage-related protein